MIERQKHLDAFEYFIELGAKAGDKNIEEIGGKFGVTANTIWNWYKEFTWRDRAIIRLVAAKNKAEEDGVFSKEVEMAALLTLVSEKIDEVKLRSSYQKALYAQAKERIEKKDIELKTMPEMLALSKSMDFSDKTLQELIKLKLLILGEPDSRQATDTVPGLVIIGVDASKYPPPIGSGDNGKDNE